MTAKNDISKKKMSPFSKSVKKYTKIYPTISDKLFVARMHHVGHVTSYVRTKLATNHHKHFISHTHHWISRYRASDTYHCNLITSFHYVTFHLRYFSLKNVSDSLFRLSSNWCWINCSTLLEDPNICNPAFLS